MSVRSLVVAVVAALCGCLLMGPQPAAALPGLERVQGDSLRNRDEPSKFAAARCPAGKLVVGGGAEVLDGDRKLVRLTGLWPNRPESPSERGGSFSATAEAANGGRPYDWSLRAYAVCAYAAALDRYYVAWHDSPFTSTVFKETSARCPSGLVTYGAGATVDTAADGSGLGKVFLQLYRTSGPLDISRATGRVMPGFDGRWGIRSYAICAGWRDQLFADGTLSQSAAASDRCRAGFTHGIGGGGGLTDGGPVWLEKIAPHQDLQGVDVSLTGALAPSIGGMVAHETCAF